MDREAWRATVHGVKKGWTWLSDKAQNNIYVKILPLLFFLFSHTVMSNSLQPHGLQHARPLCPSPCPRVCPSSCSLHQWCCSAISSYDTLFSFCSQYPAFIITYLYFFNSFFYVSLPLILLPKIHPPHSYPPFSSQPFNVRGIRDQIDNICWIIGKAREFQKEKKKNLLLFHWLHKSPWLCGSQLWEILKDTGVPDHLTCLLSNCMQDKRQQLEPDLEQRSDSKLERSNIKAVYFVALLI